MREDVGSKTDMIRACEEEMHRCPMRRCERLPMHGFRRGDGRRSIKKK